MRCFYRETRVLLGSMLAESLYGYSRLYRIGRHVPVAKFDGVLREAGL